MAPTLTWHPHPNMAGACSLTGGASSQKVSSISRSTSGATRGSDAQYSPTHHSTDARACGTGEARRRAARFGMEGDGCLWRATEGV